MNTMNPVRSMALSIAVCAVLASAVGQAAENTVTLSVQSAGTAAPQVRSVRRASADAERVEAAVNETVEVLFADGTSITMSPQSRLVIEHYRYDRASRLGELRVRLESGAARFVGGVLNNTSAVQVSTPHARATVDNAIAYVQASSDRTDVVLVAGRALTVEADGKSRTVERAGYALSIDRAGNLGSPTKASRADLQRYTAQVNPGLESGVAPMFVLDDGGSAGALPEVALLVSEDNTAKDVKMTPIVADPINPGVPCTAGTCVAAASFDLATSIGTIGNRQVGRTLGAQWLRQYNPGNPITTRAINTPAPDFSAAGDGFRSSTARIFAASSSPYSLTLTPSSTMSAIDYATLGCSAGISGACRTSAIVNLYDGTGFGVVYRPAGFNGDRTEEVHLAYPVGMSQGTFDLYPLLFRIPFDLSDQGTVNAESVRTTITGCKDGLNDCRKTYATAAARNAAMANPGPGFFDGYAPTASGQIGLFSNYVVSMTASQETFGGVTDYHIDTTFSGESAYDIYSLHTGFALAQIYNRESSVNDFCALGQADCDAFLSDMFGTNGFGLPLINPDLSDPFYDPLFGAPEQSGNVLVRSNDAFLVVDAISRLTGDAAQRMFYAVGSVSGRLPGGATAQGTTLDSFRLSAGLAPDAAMGRAFLRPETLLNIAPSAVLSSDLKVLNAAYSSTLSTPSRALQYDFAAVGTGTEQTSTISVTLGELTYDPATNRAQLAARTVGSTARSGATRYSGAMQSALFSTAVGGGNPNLANTGRAGYLVLENYDPVSAPMGGVERTVENGTVTQTNYALLRFGQVASGGSVAAPTRTSASLSGYAAGFIEVMNSTGTAVSVVPLTSLSDPAASPSGFTLSTNAAAGTISASLDATLPTDGVAVSFGGTGAASAYTGNREFAAFSAARPNLSAGEVADPGGANAAIISGAPLIGATSAQGWTGTIDARTRAAMSETGYRHLQWGFFFGDVRTENARNAHAHLIGWVAGRPTPEGTPLPAGTVDYAGHVFANINAGNQLYSAVGSYSNQWNFATRTGTGRMSLDGQDYQLATRLVGLERNGTVVTSASTARFEGLISTPAEPGYVGGLNGSFVADPAATTDPLQLRSALMGEFSLQRTLNGAAYGAVGTFGAERQP